MKTKNKLYMMSALLTLMIMGIVCIAGQVAPFGDNSFMIIDALHQYVPFFSEYQDKLQNGQSLFYSWNGGLGINFLSLFSYYLASPFNLSLTLGKQEWLNAMLSMLIVVKLCLTSVFATCFFIYHPVYKDNRKEQIYQNKRSCDWRIVMFALAYTFSNYTIGYCWNIMWIDVWMVFPLILLGMDILIIKRDGRLYTATLFYALFCNYYMTYMVCLFLIGWFFVYHYHDWKEFIKSGLRFTAHSILAALMAAVVLVPAYLGLKQTAAKEEIVPGWELYGNLWEVLSAHHIWTVPVSNDSFDGRVNLYAGMFMVFFGMLYLFARKIPIRTRLKKIALLMVLLMSFQIPVLNYVWHGCHNQYGIPNRFAFLYIFLLLLMAYEVLREIRSISWIPIGLSYVVVMTVILYTYMNDIGGVTWDGVLVGLSVLHIYMLLVFMLRFHLISWRKWKRTLAVIGIIEISMQAIYGFCMVGQVSISKFFSDTNTIAHVKRLYPTEKRIELNHNNIIDEVTYHRLPGLSFFGSTAQNRVTKMMGNLGIYTGANEYLYQGSTPFTDSVFGIEYLLAREGEWVTNDMEFVNREANVEIFYNPYALSLGFGVSDMDNTVLYGDGNPFHYQNELAKKWSEDSIGDLFYDIPVKETELSGRVYKAQIPIKEKTDLYLYLWDNQMENITVSDAEGNVYYDEEINNQMIHVGKLTKKTTIHVEIRAKDGDAYYGPSSFYAAGYEKRVLSDFYSVVSEQEWQIASKEANEIVGTIQMKNAGIMITTIPYDEGWSVRVDGRKVQTQEAEGTFLSIPLDSGQHDVEMKYQSPGFIPGLIGSVLGWVVYIIVYNMSIFRRTN